MERGNLTFSLPSPSPTRLGSCGAPSPDQCGCDLRLYPKAFDRVVSAVQFLCFSRAPFLHRLASSARKPCLRGAAGHGRHTSHLYPGGHRLCEVQLTGRQPASGEGRLTCICKKLTQGRERTVGMSCATGEGGVGWLAAQVALVAQRGRWGGAEQVVPKVLRALHGPGKAVQNENGQPLPRSRQTPAHRGTATTRFPEQLQGCTHLGKSTARPPKQGKRQSLVATRIELPNLPTEKAVGHPGGLSPAVLLLSGLSFRCREPAMTSSCSVCPSLMTCKPLGCCYSFAAPFAATTFSGCSPRRLRPSTPAPATRLFCPPLRTFLAWMAFPTVLDGSPSCPCRWVALAWCLLLRLLSLRIGRLGRIACLSSVSTCRLRRKLSSVTLRLRFRTCRVARPRRAQIRGETRPPTRDAGSTTRVRGDWRQGAVGRGNLGQGRLLFTTLPHESVLCRH